MSKNNYSYGAVGKETDAQKAGAKDSGDSKDEGGDFKETDLLYVQDSLSPKEKRMKIIKIAVPIIVAVVLIGGLALFLLRGFTNLYPGPSGSKIHSYSSEPEYLPSSSSSSSTNKRSPVSAPLTPSTTFKTATSTEDETTAASSTKENTSSSSSSYKNHAGSSSCGDNQKCKAAGLTGQCCPTVSGDMLDCCG
jgi:cytoskeletal protein RodZ